MSTRFVNSALASGLAFAGALPFLAAAAAIVFRFDLPVPALAILRAYGLTIAAFMAGSVWGYALNVANGPAYLVASNALALAAFAADRLREPRIGLGVDIIVLVALLLVDFMAARAGLLSRGYVRMRVSVTALVAAALGAAWAAL